MQKFNRRSFRIIVSLTLGIPAYAVFALIRNFPFSQITDYSYTQYSIAAFIAFFIVFELQHLKSGWLNHHLSWEKNITSRIFVELFSSFVITCIVVISVYSFLYKIVWNMDIFMPSVFLYISIVFFISLCFTALVNVVPIIQEWKRSIIMNEVLEKETIQAKLTALRTQLSPHFLFNNLSILSGLIDQNTKEAKEFTNKMSEVFRYILAHKNDELVPLKEEIDFIKDYAFLLKTRFKDKFKVDIEITDFNYLIPPVTLQQLIENAIKHNEISFKNPLVISIRQEGKELLIENKLLPKKTEIKSTGIGLISIVQRFALLTDRGVSYLNGEGSFKVQLPLLTIHENSYN